MRELTIASCKSTYNLEINVIYIKIKKTGNLMLQKPKMLSETLHFENFIANEKHVKITNKPKQNPLKIANWSSKSPSNIYAF